MNIKDLKKRAVQGDTSAQSRLGYVYEVGEGVRKNIRTAVEWYKKAAKAGDPGAQLNLGRCYRDGIGLLRNVPAAAKLFRAAADQGLELADTVDMPANNLIVLFRRKE